MILTNLCILNIILVFLQNNTKQCCLIWCALIYDFLSMSQLYCILLITLNVHSYISPRCLLQRHALGDRLKVRSTLECQRYNYQFHNEMRSQCTHPPAPHSTLTKLLPSQASSYTHCNYMRDVMRLELGKCANVYINVIATKHNYLKHTIHYEYNLSGEYYLISYYN